MRRVLTSAFRLNNLWFTCAFVLSYLKVGLSPVTFGFLSTSVTSIIIVEV